MCRKYRLCMGMCIGFLLLSSPTAWAQVPAQEPAPVVELSLVELQPSESGTQQQESAKPRPIYSAASGLLKEDDYGPSSPLEVSKWLEKTLECKTPCGLNVYGWLEGSYTYSSSGPGLMNVAPRPNRFGDEGLLNSAAIAIEKPLTKDWSWGFNVCFVGGADAATFYPSKGGLLGGSITPVQSLGINAITPGTPPNLRMAIDFTDLNLTAHLPIFTEGGIDIKLGRQSSPIRADDSARGPLRVFESMDYNTMYGTEGRFTGLLANFHVTPQLDWYAGITMGFTSFFEMDTVGPNFITQINYWLQEDKRTMLTCGLVTGPMTGDVGILERVPQFVRTTENTTQLELRITQYWNKYFTQVLASDLTWARDTRFGLGPDMAGGIVLYNIFHLTPCLDFNTRLEWYRDNANRDAPAQNNGINTPGGTEFRSTYYEATAGFDIHPYPWLRFRPEVRYDYAPDNTVYGIDFLTNNVANTRHGQTTAVFDVILQW